MENSKYKTKMGRPLIGEEPRNRRISLRTTQTIQDRLRRCAEITGRKQSELLEDAVNALYDRLAKGEE